MGISILYFHPDSQQVSLFHFQYAESCQYFSSASNQLVTLDFPRSFSKGKLKLPNDFYGKQPVILSLRYLNKLLCPNYETVGFALQLTVITGEPAKATVHC